MKYIVYESCVTMILVLSVRSRYLVLKGINKYEYLGFCIRPCDQTSLYGSHFLAS